MSNSSGLFNEKVAALFTAIGGEYVPVLDDDVEIVFTLESGQTIHLSETTNEKFEILASLGPAPAEPTLLATLLIANRDTQLQFPVSFFITSDAVEACAVLHLPLINVSVEEVVDGFQRIVNSCNWYLEELLALPNTKNSQPQSQIKV
ncbi:type III secretion system chaperone family protein [Spartinivicinus ruber]|uniref:hypothetical protein n=1 Tax=Spartinivicinus ruber TaxID=2683272 RepID=UPI0013D79BA9|nr:hypothetical protein [Spartinivicinus ruber]